MAVTKVGSLALPPPILIPTLNQNVAFSASTHRAANICQAPKDGSIDLVRFATNAVTTGATLEVRIESVDSASGNPSGSLVAAGASGTVVVDAADDNTWLSCTIGTPPTVNKGDNIAIVLQVSSGVPSLNLHANASCDYVMKQHFPYYTRYDGASWSKTGSYSIGMVLRYDGDTDYTAIPYVPAGRWNGLSFSTTTTPDAFANRFSLPFTATFAGWWLRTAGNAAADMTLTIEEDDGTVLATYSYDATYRATTTGITSFAATEDVTLTKNTYYRVVATPSTTTSDQVAFGTQYQRSAVPELDDWVSQQQTDLGAWSDYDTDSIWALGIYVSHIELSAGGAISYGF